MCFEQCFGRKRKGRPLGELEFLTTFHQQGKEANKNKEGKERREICLESQELTCKSSSWYGRSREIYRKLDRKWAWNRRVTREQTGFPNLRNWGESRRSGKRESCAKPSNSQKNGNPGNSHHGSVSCDSGIILG